MGLAVCLAACASAPALPPEFLDPSPLPGKGAVLTVIGLGCPQCASNIDLQLAAVRGVGKVEVDLSQGLVVVDFDAEPHPSRRDLATAVHESGFSILAITQQ